MLMDDNGLKYAIQVFRDIKKDSLNVAHKFAQQYTSWSRPDTYCSLLQACTSNNCLINLKKLCRNKAESPFQDIEAQLYLMVADKQIKGQRVSSTFMRLTALKLFANCKEDSPDKWTDVSFKASNGWLCRFIARRYMKYRKRKSGKEHTVAKLLSAYVNFLANLRFKFIVPTEIAYEQDPLWGCFPPHLHYNFDQVPLPFVVEQEYTFTMDDDAHPHINAPSEALRRCQFTMHVVTNAGVGEKAHGWVDFVCRGKGTRVHVAEKEMWDDRVSVEWQQNAWVDNNMMERLAHGFLWRKIEKHGEEAWAIAFCDNLKAHVNEQVQDIFGKGRVFLCFSPPNMTNIVQPIDAAIGQSLWIAIGHALDRWLMDGEKMMK